MEDSRDLIQLFDAHLVDFLPNMGIIPIGIVMSEDKKSHVYH
jgi:hypothetical protein